MSSATYEIPIDQIDSGLNECASNVRRLIDDCRMMMKDGSQWHAAAMAIFALEELVKLYVLKRGYESAVLAGKSLVDVDERVFGRGRRSHQFKLSIARQEKLIPEEAWVIHEGFFDDRYFDPRYFDIGTVISATLRTESIFVDWDVQNKCWVNRPVIDSQKLETFVQSVAVALKRIE
jgi:AbiV family abortive infection protein